MNRDLPESKFFEDFYIWFNQDKKEEYYSTPLYYLSFDQQNRLATIASL